jgi:hypothetical protein
VVEDIHDRRNVFDERLSLAARLHHHNRRPFNGRQEADRLHSESIPLARECRAGAKSARRWIREALIESERLVGDSAVDRRPRERPSSEGGTAGATEIISQRPANQFGFPVR